MPRVIVVCGRLCSGKTTYAKKLRDECGAMILSADELMLALFPEGAGEKHDIYVRRTEDYLLNLSLQILQAGTDVILDWGLWTPELRRKIRSFYNDHGVKLEVIYLRLSEEEWQRRIRKRNAAVEQQMNRAAYYVDEGLLQKFKDLFREPSAEEVDRIIDSKPSE